MTQNWAVKIEGKNIYFKVKKNVNSKKLMFCLYAPIFSKLRIGNKNVLPLILLLEDQRLYNYIIDVTDSLRNSRDVYLFREYLRCLGAVLDVFYGFAT